MGQFTSNGQGTKVSTGEIRRYEKLRDAGWSPGAAADAIGRSKSWAYSHEQGKRILTKEPSWSPQWSPERGRAPRPAPNLANAVGAVLALLRDDSATFFDVLEEFGLELVFEVSELAAFLAGLYANDYLQPRLEEALSVDDRDQQKAGSDHASDVELFLEVIPFLLDRITPERAERPERTA